MKRVDFTGCTALVTGAGSGMGRELAVQLAARKAHLALADVDEAGLMKTAEACRSGGADRVTTHRLDVSDADAVAGLPAAVEGDHGELHLLFNNAGIGASGPFAEVAAAEFERVMDVNFNGLVRMTRAFLPLLARQGWGRVVNTCSLWGLLAPPNNAAYSASKFAVNGFSQSLAHELKGTSVGVTIVYPGGVATRISEGAVRPAGMSALEVEAERERDRKLLTLPPDVAARRILQAVERGKARATIGSDAWQGALLARIFPTRYWDVITKLGRV